MLYTDFTRKLLGLQGLIVTNVEEKEESILIYAEMERKVHNCIRCGTATDTVHDYRKQVIKDSVNISRAHWYKEDFLKILDFKDHDKAKNALAEWIKNAQCCGLVPFEKCAQTMANWYNGIINSLSSPVPNGFTEGCNNKIKVLKRNAYGYQNFKRFRNRILHIFSYQKIHINQAAA